MKKSFLTLILLVFAVIVNAQEVAIDSVFRGFQGVFPAEDGNLYYTYYTEDKPGSRDKATLVVYAWNAELKPIDTSRIEINRNDYVMASCMNMNIYLFKLGSPAKRTITTIANEIKKGVISNTTEQNVPSDYFKPGHFMNIYPTMPEGFIIVTETYDKKNGYKIECIDRTMKEKWSKTITPDKGNFDVISANSVMERFILLRKETNGKKVTSALQGFQADIGEEMFVTNMDDEDYSYMVTGINSHMDLMSLAGLYYKNGNADKKPAGIFFNVLGPAGDAMHSFKIPVDDLSESLSGGIAANISSGKLKLFPHDIARKPGGYVGIAELYTSEPVSANETSFQLNDLLLFSFKEGSPEPADEPEPAPDPENPDVTPPRQQERAKQKRGINVTVLPKTSREAIIKGEMANSGDLQIAEWLKKQNFFSYRAITTEGVPRLIYRTDDSTGAKAYFLAVEDSIKVDMMIPFDPIFRGQSGNDSNKTAKKTAQPGTDGKYVFETPVGEFIPPYQNKGLIPMRGNKAVYYILRDDNQLIVWINNLL